MKRDAGDALGAKTWLGPLATRERGTRQGGDVGKKDNEVAGKDAAGKRKYNNLDDSVEMVEEVTHITEVKRVNLLVFLFLGRELPGRSTWS